MCQVHDKVLFAEYFSGEIGTAHVLFSLGLKVRSQC